MPYYFYVLRSVRDGRLYKGVTADIGRRLAQHNAGKTRSLKHRRPFVLAFCEAYDGREEALSRERWSKTSPGAEELRRLMSQKECGSPPFEGG